MRSAVRKLWRSLVGGQGCPEGIHRAMKPRLRSPERNAEGRGYVGQRQVGEVDEGEDRPLVRRQAAERLLELIVVGQGAGRVGGPIIQPGRELDLGNPRCCSCFT